ncbi:hypothetical protein KAS41_02875 [Candidatus Parcubacteria bacterium]|nr:hypothetical protein [Candidatus Parcubacteria bacterium]
MLSKKNYKILKKYKNGGYLDEKDEKIVRHIESIGLIKITAKLTLMGKTVLKGYEKKHKKIH